MVHALEKAHRLLEPAGRLIDIHPPALDAVLEVWSPGHVETIGLIRETDDGIEYGRAEAALAEIVGRGLFEIEHDARFTFSRHAPSLAELRRNLEVTWSDAVIDTETAARIDAELARGGPQAAIVLRENPRIRRLRPCQAAAPAERAADGA